MNKPLQPYFADLHVHIGRTDNGTAVKISASRDLTFRSIAHEASERKGVQLIGVIDCHSPAVQADIERCLDTGEMEEADGGGIRYRDTVILLGAEMEVREEGGGPFHLLGYLPDLASMKEWTAWMAPRMKNVNLSSQRLRVTARELQAELLARGGLLVPAHVFTPHRGLLGCSADRLADRLDPEGIAAVELGLSSDSDMADRITELARYPFLTNSDAHSTGMIGRECNELLLQEPSFAEWAMALRGQAGRKITANYGLHPQLGKYHTTYCAACRKALSAQSDEGAEEACPSCGSRKLIRGVSGRIDMLADREEPVHPEGRAPYLPQVPLNFFPGIGKVTREKLLREAGTEMEVLHRAPEEKLAAAAGAKIASAILAAREGKLSFTPGSGGTYGKLSPPF
ncbi:endonuclease Q family protein [Cohnella candidum]|uniref:TIGR00375 family protein n=1 Tax=Cohnella candidum TaxID=2674991 RepID=A0A3G3JX16_9BACL|nr:endonuclease Q family protein [Cohnella candidum]AYQ72790.1 TIGR00375 family protein [Cohnella candidum]